MDHSTKPNTMRNTLPSYADLHNKCGNAQNLPEMPESILQLLNILDDADVKLHEVERIVLASPALSAGVMRAACSAAYGLRLNANTTIKTALNTLGTRELERIAIGEWIQAIAMKPCTKSGFNAMRFGAHSLFVGFLASYVYTRALRRQQFTAKVSADQVFSIGVLHDLSLGLLASVEPMVYFVLSAKAKAEGVSVAHVFLKHYHARLETLGQAAVTAWNLPVVFQDVLWFAENGARHPEEPYAYACVDYANAIAEQQGFGVHTWEIEVEVSDAIIREVGIPAEDFDEVLDVIKRHTLALAPLEKAA